MWYSPVHLQRIYLLILLDLDQFIETNVLTPEDFTLNFKSLKSKKKDIDKLLDQEKVDCCTISLIPMKGNISSTLISMMENIHAFQYRTRF